jgi:HSP20 family protein
MNAVAKRNERSEQVADRERKPQRLEEQVWFAPDVNILEMEDTYLLEADMPGVGKDGLEITLEGNTLSILGHRAEPEFGENPFYRESRRGGFRRVFELDPAIDTSKINAKMENGILKLRLPKAEKVKPRKIQVSD